MPTLPPTATASGAHPATAGAPDAYTEDNSPDDSCNVIVAQCSGSLLVSHSPRKAIMQLPLPGIVIFVHGVNSDGEWFQAAEEGLCQGLNDRLKRRAEHLAYPTVEGGQLRPAQYMAELSSDGFVDPDRNSKNFIAEDAHFSPVIHFRWGYKAGSMELQEFGNGIYLNEHNYWGGGPFANGCTSLPDLWGAGLADQMFLWLHVQHMNPTSRRVYACPPRPYFVLAAMRLARLVEAIRQKQADVPITIVCHSQGNMIGMAAAFLGDRFDDASDPAGKMGRCVADNYILCNPPYSLVTDNAMQGIAEFGMKDKHGNGGRQSYDSRKHTMVEFFKILRRQAKAEQPAEKIDEAMANTAHGFNAASDRARYGFGQTPSTYGRVTLYFNPHDQVISASTIQGIGWRGMNEHEMRGTEGSEVFSQRVFAQGYKVGVKGKYNFWLDQHNRPKRGSDQFWYPESPHATYEPAKGAAANSNLFGTILTWVTAPLMIAATSVMNVRINAKPPTDWKTPLTAPDLPEPFEPQAVRFGQASDKFDQGMDAPGEYRATERLRGADDPYGGEHTVPVNATEDLKRKGSDAAEGNLETEAALRYEHHALLRMDAKREHMYKNDAQVTEEDKPETASAAYKVWRTKKIRAEMAENVNAHATDHSTIMTNPKHAQKALAYDVAIGACYVTPEDLHELRIMADWRMLKAVDKNSPSKKFEEYFKFGLLNKSALQEWTKAGEAGMPDKIRDEREVFGSSKEKA